MDYSSRGYIGALLALISAVYFREVCPYRIDFTNVIAVVAQYTLMILYLSAVKIETDSLSKFGLSNFLLGLILLVLTSSIVVLALYVGHLRHQREQAELAAAEARKL